MKRRRNQENAKFGTYKNQTIYYRVFSAMGEIRLDLFVLQKNKKKVIGFAVAQWDDDSDVGKDAKNECKKESVRLAKKIGYPDAIGLYVKDTNIDDKYKGIGMGKAMYKLLAAILYQFLIKYPFIMMPDFCNQSYTSPEALRVWKSLAKDFPSDMSSVAGIPLPIIAITKPVPFAPLKFPLPKRKKNSLGYTNNPQPTKTKANPMKKNPRRRKNPEYIVTLDDGDGEMLYLVEADSATEAKKIFRDNHFRPLRRGAKITAKIRAIHADERTQNIS